MTITISDTVSECANPGSKTARAGRSAFRPTVKVVYRVRATERGSFRSTFWHIRGLCWWVSYHKARVGIDYVTPTHPIISKQILRKKDSE